jgi:hypothetical protein
MTPSSNSPFIVGVSGHRDLDDADLPRLRAAVMEFFRALREAMPDTELRLLTGVAEGADLLVAETARGLGVRIEAVLPMPLGRYAADFDGESLARLRALLNHADVDCIELVDPADPEAGYGNLMHALLRRSSLLLAVWDGEPSALPVGTADTVLRFLDVRTGGPADDLPLEFIDVVDTPEAPNRLVYWIPASRRGSPPPGSVPAPCYLSGVGDHTLERRAGMPKAFQARLHELNAYNLEHETLRELGQLGAHDSLLRSLPEDIELRGLSRLEHIDQQYAKADALAVHFQKRSDRLFVLFGLMTLAMGLAYLIYEKLTESRIMLFAYLAVLLVSLALYYVLEGRRWFAKHLAYRALAETMRAKFYLRLAGADHRVDAREILALSGTDRFHGFGWLGFVLNGVERVGVRAQPSYHPASPQSRCVEDSWIESQHSYFTRKVAHLERSTGRTRTLRNALFLVIIGAILTLFIFGEVLLHIDAGWGIPAKNVVTFMMGFFAVLLGAWELHQNKMATRELLWQYRNQLTHFTRARNHLACIADAERRSEVLADLGKDSMMESYLWTIHRYHREHEPPSTGGG